MASNIKRAIPIMIQGTHSDAGKSLIATALCRIYAEEGFRTAPFKSQNMSLNSYVTIDGKEIGRAQGVQAEAAGIIATTDMNPILIKPSGESQSQIVVHGKPMRTMQAGEYRSHFYEVGKRIIKDSYTRLSHAYDRIVIEGAGSPAEINLNDRELVNMHVAQMAQSPVILVSDIDRGGVFASLVGTLELLNSHDRSRVIGVIINKFRGDLELLKPGLTWFEQYTEVPVLGVMPYLEQLNIEAEDSLALSQYVHPSHPRSDKPIDIAVIALSRISNFTDIDPLTIEQDCSVRLVQSVEELQTPDVIILPGSKNVIEDVLAIQANGLAQAIVHHAEQGVAIVGICGGYQMLGKTIDDPHGVESSVPSVDGLGLLPVRTTLQEEKLTIRSKGIAVWDDVQCELKGYEIHMGRTDIAVEPFMMLQSEEGEHAEGCRSGETIFGTYLHGLFHNDEFRTVFLNRIRRQKGLALVPHDAATDYSELRDADFQRLAKTMREHVDLEKMETLIERYKERM